MRRRTFAVLIALFGVLYLLLAVLQPDGSWDAWAIWNLRARFFAYAPDITTAFDPAMSYSHLDYPPLLPAVIALGWRTAGDTRLVPIVIHGAIYLAALGMLRDRHWWVLALVGAVGLGYAPSQCADMPLAATLLAAAVAYLHHRQGWVGVVLGLGLLIKNEGTLIALSFFAVWILIERQVPWRALLNILPFAMLLIAFKWWVNVPNDVISSAGLLDRALEPKRYVIIGLGTLQTLLTFGNNAFLILAACLWVGAIRPVWNVPVAAVGVAYLGYLVVYVITPSDLIWHMHTSHDRLLWQLFPAFVYGITHSAPPFGKTAVSHIPQSCY
jgi:hypothetical protein